VIDGLPVGALTPIALACLVLATPYLFLARGRLIPKSTHDEIVRNHLQRIVVLEATNKSLLEQNGVLLNSSVPTVNAVMNALHHAAEGDHA
jgi:hypothetical protein